MSQSSNFHRLNDLLAHSCNSVLRLLLPSVIERERPSTATTIDELIQFDRSILERKRIVIQNAFHVFPSNSIKIERWDLQLLCFFITYVCPPNDVICFDINSLKSIRNDICHTSNGLILDADYQMKRDEVKLIISNLLGIIRNDTFTESIECEIAEIDNGTRSIPDALDTLREWLDRDKQQRTPIYNISDEQQEMIDRLRATQRHLPVPDAEIDIVVENADNIQQQDQVSETLVNILDPRLRSNPHLCGLTESCYTAVKNEVRECMDQLLESGQAVVGATYGCVIITVRSTTFASLERLWRKLVSAESIMAPLQEILRKTFSERLVIKAVLPECSFLHVVEKLVQQIQKLDQDGSHARHERYTQIAGISDGMEKANSKSTVNFKIRPKNLRDYEQLHRYLSVGKLDAAFKNITDVFRQELNVPKLMISATHVRKKDIQTEKWNPSLKPSEPENQTNSQTQKDTEKVSSAYPEETNVNKTKDNAERTVLVPNRRLPCFVVTQGKQLARLSEEKPNAQTLGKAGRVRRIGEDGDMTQQSLVFSPVTCRPLDEPDNVANLPNLIKSELEERDDLRKLRDKVNGFDESYASLMVDYNNDVDKQPDETVGIEALIEATRTGDVDTVKTIIRQNPSLVNTQCRHETVLHIAAYERHEEIVELLLKQGASVNSFDDDDRDTALHFAAFGDSAACMQLLLDHNARVDAQNKYGFTCLHITVGKTNLDCTKILLEAGASPNIKDKDGATPMHEVIIQRKWQAILVSYLFGSAKADFTVVNSRGFNVLQWAALKDCLTAVKEILERKPEMKDTQMKEGYTALHICAANGHVEIAYELMKARANKEMEDSKKRTPLILAVMQGRTKMVQLLINEHCNVDHVDNEGNTALHHAQSSRQMSDTEARRLEVSMNNDVIGIELMSLLLKAGAKIDIRNNKGQTVMDLCREEDVREFSTRGHDMATTKIYPMSDGKAVLPTHWDAFLENEHVHVVTLDSTRSGHHQREYQEVKNKFCKTLTQKRIISVKRIQNKFLWEQYFDKRVNMDRVLGPGHLNEFDLYHGTGPDIVEGIIANNVDVRLAGDKVGTKLGHGSYFARDAKLSDGYADPDANGHKFMFQVRVLCGRWTHGQPDLTRPPEIDPANPKSRLYDCCVDNDRNPGTFCLFDQNQYYPEYLIEYT